MRDFLVDLRQRLLNALEVKNIRWLDDHLYSLLRKQGIALALTDSPRMLLVEEVTADFVYIRWEGDRRDSEGKNCKVEIDRAEVQQWKDRIEKLLKESATIIRCFSKHYSGYPSEDARHLLKAFAEQEWVKLWNC